MRFINRIEAGHALARVLAPLKGEADLVVAIPSGGVPVGYELARALEVPLEVLVVRCVCAPGEPDRMIAAVAESGAMDVDPPGAPGAGLPAKEVALLEHEASEAERFARRYRGERPPLNVRGRCVVLADDGVATGKRARAAARCLRERGARRIVLAAPVVTAAGAESVRPHVDEVHWLEAPDELLGIGYWYVQVRPSEEDALKLLARAEQERGEAMYRAGP